MTTDELLKQGIAALKAGRKAEARNLLMQVVEQDERNEMAWLWLSGAVDTDEERRICLENVLAINPNNGVARRGLESLIAKEGVRSLSADSSPTPRAEPAVTPREQPIQSPAEASVPDVAQRKRRKPPTKRKKAAKKRTGLMIGLGAMGLVLVCVALASVWWAMDSGLLQFGPAVPVVPIPTAPPIPTWTPTSTPRPTRTATPTPDLCTFDNPEMKVYLAGYATALHESGVAMECATQRGSIGPGIAPCTEQLRAARRNFSALWYPPCANTQRRALVACLDEEIAALEACEDRNEDAFVAHMARFEKLLAIAKRENDELLRILEEKEKH